MHILIIDDDKIRFPKIQAYLREVYGVTVGFTFSDGLPSTFHGYDVLSLDHDLGPKGDVYDALRHKDLDYFTGTVFIHSMNPVGAQNLKRLFRNAKVYIKPYSSMVQDIS